MLRPAPLVTRHQQPLIRQSGLRSFASGPLFPTAYGVSCRACAGKIALRPGATTGQFAPYCIWVPRPLPDLPVAVRRFGRRSITHRGGMSSSLGGAGVAFVESTLRGSLPPCRYRPVVPRAGAARARALARTRRFPRVDPPPRGRSAVRLLRGPADRERAPRLAPRPEPGVQGRLPALQDDAGPLRPAQGRLGLPRPSGGARGREGARLHQQARHRAVRDRRVQRALPGVGAALHRRVERADRADRLLDRHERRVLHARPELRRVGLVVAEAGVGERPSGRGQQGRAVLHPLRHRALLTRAGARLQGRVDPSVFVRFPLVDDPDVSLLAWTTMPWTLVPHAAVAVDPDVDYVRARLGDPRSPASAGQGAGGRLILAEALVERVLGEDAEIEERMPGSALLGLRYEPPFPYISDYGPKGHTVLAGDFVSIEDGTGVVHTGAAFGEDDYSLATENGLTIHNPVRGDGTFDDRAGPFADMYVRDADAPIVEALRESGRLFRSEQYEHAYPHCWRCGTALIYYAKTSWYVRTTAVKDELLAANETIDWHPGHIKHGRFGKWLENNVDWALSRERYWGTPLPVWRCEEGHDVCVGSLAEIAERGGAPPEDVHRPYIDDVVLSCADCG